MNKILIVDDSLFMRKVISNILQDIKGIKILEASSGKEALILFNKEHPDLVLLDIVMPGGEEEGVRVLERILEKNRRAKVVMISAVGQEIIIEECKKLGAKDYIVKPFDEEKVINIVQKHLK